MESKFINVNYNSTFRIGSASCHYTKKISFFFVSIFVFSIPPPFIFFFLQLTCIKATITLFGPYDATTNVVPFMGTKNVIVQGLLEWYGTPPQPTWTSVTATVNPNATTITVKDTVRFKLRYKKYSRLF